MALPIRYNLRSLWQRRWSTASTAMGVGLVVAVFVSVLGLAEGLARAFVQTGSEDNLIVVRDGASSRTVSALGEATLEQIRALPEVRRGDRGRAHVSAEVVTNVTLPTGHDDGSVLVTVRGVDPMGYTVHRGVEIRAGRAPRGRGEVAVGVGLQHQIEGLGVGSRLRFGRSEWTVVGELVAGGNSYESELWTDRRALMHDLMREHFNYVAVTVEAPDRAAVGRIARRWSEAPQLGVTAYSEARYYGMLARTSDRIRLACWVLVAVMSVGAVLGGMNTMYGLLIARVREMATLRVLGYSNRAILASMLIESCLIATSGGVVGLALGGVADGLPMFFEGVRLQLAVGGGVLAQGLALALVIGLLGGWLPARAASKLEVVDALRAP